MIKDFKVDTSNTQYKSNRVDDIRGRMQERLKAMKDEPIVVNIREMRKKTACKNSK